MLVRALLHGSHMHRSSRKKLQLARETLRALTLTPDKLGRVAGGISGLRTCHSLEYQCRPAVTETLCNASAETDCVSGLLCP